MLLIGVIGLSYFMFVNVSKYKLLLNNIVFVIKKLLV